MCGRFGLDADFKTIKSQFNLEELAEIEPGYNIAPSDTILAVVETAKDRRAGRLFHWGLIPFWAKEQNIGNRLINARAESVKDKPAFRHAFKKQRCLVVMSGFFEWQTRDGKKQPYYIYAEDNRLLAVAALWEAWDNPETKETLYSCCLMTTDANPFMQAIHNRMPVLINEKDYDTWLDADNDDVNTLESLLTPYLEHDLTCHKVTRKMNNVRFKSKEAIEPVE